MFLLFYVKKAFVKKEEYETNAPHSLCYVLLDGTAMDASLSVIMKSAFLGLIT